MTESKLHRIGFIGLGKMGEPMVRRLLEAGYEVTGFDASADAVTALAGADGFLGADTAAATAAGADVVILMLPNSDIVEHVLVGSGVLAAMSAGSIVIDMGSSVPQRTREMAARAAELGIELIDAPVSGGVSGAESGRLTVMVSGPPDAVGRVHELLEVLGARVIAVGEVGAADAIKALNNLMSATHLLVTSEAMLGAQRFGLDPAVVLDVVNGSSGRSGSTDNKWPNFILPGSYDSGFGLRLMLKDMRIALALLQEAGIPAELSERAVEMWEAAAAELPPDADHTEIAKWVDSATVQGETK